MIQIQVCIDICNDSISTKRFINLFLKIRACVFHDSFNPNQIDREIYDVHISHKSLCRMQWKFDQCLRWSESPVMVNIFVEILRKLPYSWAWVSGKYHEYLICLFLECLICLFLACTWKGGCKDKDETWFDTQTCTKYGCLADEDGLDVNEITYGIRLTLTESVT